MAKEKLKLDCEGCGSSLIETDNPQKYLCEKCGTLYKVEFDFGGIKITKIEERLKNIEQYTILLNEKSKVEEELKKLSIGLDGLDDKTIQQLSPTIEGPTLFTRVKAGLSGLGCGLVGIFILFVIFLKIVKTDLLNWLGDKIGYGLFAVLAIVVILILYFLVSGVKSTATDSITETQKRKILNKRIEQLNAKLQDTNNKLRNFNIQ